MEKFFNSCRRCLNPWVLGLIVVGVIGLLIFVPIIGVAGLVVAGLVVAAPLIGCTLMCVVMAFFMKGDKHK